MRTKMNGEIEINAPAKKVWRVLGEQFEHIGLWASAIQKSKPIPGNASLQDAHVAGRVCTVNGFGEIEENLTRYDNTEKVFSYTASKGLPWFIKKAENTWSVRPNGENGAVITSEALIEANFFPGILLLPIFKLQMKFTGRRFFEELKYYLEHDKPHPRKQKLLKKSQ